LNRFVTISAKFRKRTAKDGTRFVVAKHRHCKKEDFRNRKYYKSLPSRYSTYICFEYENVKEYFTLKNGYVSDSNNEMESVYIELNKC